MTAHSAPSAYPSLHPFRYTVLYAPFGVLSGFVVVALAHLATRRGLTIQDGATLVAIGMLPHTWKFLWAPIVDTTLTRKRWYIISMLACAISIVATTAVPLAPSSLSLLQVLIFVGSLATTFLGFAVEGLMAYATPPEERGRVGGLFQAGNLGGNGIGGGLGLWMSLNLPAPWMAGAVLGTLFLLGTLALRGIPDAPAESRGEPVRRVVWNVVIDLWDTVKHRRGLLACVLCFLPIGTGAAASVLAQAEVAAYWGAGEWEVELVNGLLSGTIAAIGCLVGGQICGKFPPRLVYAAVGALMAAVTALMAISPAVPLTFIVFGLVYQFVTGLAYAAFTGFVLEAIGTGAAATKYNIFAALSNTPITYMGLILGWAAASWGASRMLLIESLAGIVGLMLLGMLVMVLRALPSRAPVEEEVALAAEER